MTKPNTRTDTRHSPTVRIYGPGSSGGGTIQIRRGRSEAMRSDRTQDRPRGEMQMAEVRNWASIIDNVTRRQAELVAEAPGVAGDVALMPDAHPARGVPVGSVIPTFSDTIIPAALSVDIGCGVTACLTDIEHLPEDLEPLLRRFSEAVPSGVGSNHLQAVQAAGAWFEDNPLPDPSVLADSPGGIEGALALAQTQLGTLGSGNHFIEVCLDTDGGVWLMIHTGSRGIGNQIARAFMQIARIENVDGLEDPELARLTGGPFHAYIQMIQWAQEYATFNRRVAMDSIAAEVTSLVGDFNIVSTIDCRHNFAVLESHSGQELWVTRKGAIRAEIGDLAVVTGSMADVTHVVEGLGNPESYNSCAHGAGRMLSRREARRAFGEDSLLESMRGKTWNHDRARVLLNEHPQAYKSIDQVMKDQEDLAVSREVLTQVLNYKGT